MHKEVIFYLMETNTKTISLSFEHVGFIWLSYPQAIERLTFKNAKALLKKANLFLTENNGSI